MHNEIIFRILRFMGFFMGYFVMVMSLAFLISSYVNFLMEDKPRNFPRILWTNLFTVLGFINVMEDKFDWTFRFQVILNLKLSRKQKNFLFMSVLEPKTEFSTWDTLPPPKKFPKLSFDSEGRVNIEGNVNVPDAAYIFMDKFPVKFGKISESFKATQMCSLRTLENSPHEVGGYFDVSMCHYLRTMKGAPSIAKDWLFDMCKNIPKIEKFVMSDHEMARQFLSGEKTLEELTHTRRGTFRGSKFGI